VSAPAARLDRGTLDPTAIEHALRRALDEATPGERPMRARMSNLIVYCDSEAQAAGVPPELLHLVEQHPARILLLVGESAAGATGIEAEVGALCYRGSGGRRLCAEQVRLWAAAAARRRLPATVRPLLVGDLPSALWWATPEPPPAGELFGELAPMVDHVLYDSTGWRDPVRGVISAADWSRASQRRVTDLAWSRNAPWRRLIAETLGAMWLGGGVQTIRELEREHGPPGLPQTWLLLGWIARCLGWRLRDGRMRPGVDIAWTFESGSEPVRVTVRRLPEGSPQIRRVAIRAGTGSHAVAAHVGASDAGRVSLCIEGTAPCETRVAMRPLAPAALLAAQLSERSADPLFRDALATSRQLAQAVAH